MPWSFSAPSMLAILGAYFVAMLALTTVLAPRADAEGFIVADRDVGFGWGAASMSATWIWAASMYAAATAAFTYGISGAFHYAFWGGVGLLFIWKYGQRVRRMVPHGHTFPEFVKTRHGRLSHGVVGIENYVNSQYSLIINFTAGAAIISLFSPLSYEASLVVTAVIVVGYSILSGIRASVVTDLVQVAAMVLVAAVAVPLVFFHAGGPGAFAAALPRLGEQGQLLSLQAFLGQGAPMMALILAYAFANPTVWQRIWVVRDRQLRGTFVTSGLMYMALTFSVGTFGFV
ncbi:MAG: sodium:proline symporter, partial [Actinobacteria bacterium]|nr:sodium:proline symporter [Actinomycetota bacterium]